MNDYRLQNVFGTSTKDSIRRGSYKYIVERLDLKNDSFPQTRGSISLAIKKYKQSQ